jgi:hypothetical protein
MDASMSIQHPHLALQDVPAPAAWTIAVALKFRILHPVARQSTNTAADVTRIESGGLNADPKSRNR